MSATIEDSKENLREAMQDMFDTCMNNMQAINIITNGYLSVSYQVIKVAYECDPDIAADIINNTRADFEAFCMAISEMLKNKKH